MNDPCSRWHQEIHSQCNKLNFPWKQKNYTFPRLSFHFHQSLSTSVENVQKFPYSHVYHFIPRISLYSQCVWPPVPQYFISYSKVQAFMVNYTVYGRNEYTIKQCLPLNKFSRNISCNFVNKCLQSISRVILICFCIYCVFLHFYID